MKGIFQVSLGSPIFGGGFVANIGIGADAVGDASEKVRKRAIWKKEGSRA